MDPSKPPHAVDDELARLRGRRLGTCRTCGKPVFQSQCFTRFRGFVTHVRCASPARAAGTRSALRVGWTER